MMAVLSCTLCQAQSARTSNLRIEHNVPSGNRQLLKVNFRMDSWGVKGHEIQPILFIDREKGQAHYFADGKQMKQEGNICTPGYENTVFNDFWLGIYNDALNPLPGEHTYWVRILVWDHTLGQWISDNSINATEWVSYTMTGAAPSNNNSGGGYAPIYNNSNNYNNNSGGSASNYNNPATKRTCPICGGSGSCRQCGGTGNRVVNTYRQTHINTCGVCHGTGKCTQCHGSGKTW